MVSSTILSNDAESEFESMIGPVSFSGILTKDIGTYHFMHQADPLQSHLPLPASRWYAQESLFTSLRGSCGQICRLSSITQSLRWTKEYNIRLSGERAQ